MSQTTTSIFASPGLVLPGTRSESSTGRTASVVPKLIVSDSTGKAIQSWDLKLPKGTLGSAESCTICCRLPGVAPLHAMLVSGSQQAFVRSLAGQLSQDGVPATELLLSDDKCYFEISGYRFTLVRASVAQVESARRDAKRMQFALARPFHLSAASAALNAKEEKANEVNAPWVANVIRQAIEPLEAQIDSLLLPLAEFQSQSLQAQFANARIEEERRAVAEKERNAKEQEIVGMVVQQSATMETLAERISDVNQQLSTIERIIAQDAEANSAANTEIGKVITVQQSAIEQLQNGMVSLSDSLKQLQERQQTSQRENSNWKNEVQLQLQQLTNAVSEFSSIAENTDQSALVDAIESLKKTHEVAQAEIGRWQSGVQQQLNHLQETLTENENSQTEVPAAITEALAEIQAKHAQSLEELHSWKAELKLEMQQLFQSASVAAAQSSTETNSRESFSDNSIRDQSVAPVAMEGVRPTLFDRASSTELHSPSDPVAEGCDWTNYSTSSFVAQDDVSAECNEPFVPEVVNEDYLAQMQSQPETESAVPTWGVEESYFASQGIVSDQPIEPESSWPTTEESNYQSSEQLESEIAFENSWPSPVFDAHDVHAQIQNYDPVHEDYQGGTYDTEDSPFMTMQIEPGEIPNLESSVKSKDADPSLESKRSDSSWIDNYGSLDPQTDQQQGTDADLDSFITVKDPVGKAVELPTPEETETSASASLPSWWTADDSQDLDSVEDSITKNSQSQHTSAEYDSTSSIGTLAKPHNESNDDPGHSQREEIGPEVFAKAEDEQFFGFGLAATQTEVGQQKSSGVMSIDQLALMSDEENKSENIFDFTPQSPESRADYSRPVPDSPAQNSVAAPSARNTAPEDDSVESYMKSLLARMRGETVEAAPEPAKPVAAPTLSSGYAPSDASQQSAARQAAETAANSTEPVAPFDFENYVPLTNAPEKGKNISALRDLANSTARTAIHKSARNRTLSGSLMKFAIAAIAFTVAAALFAINGLVVNVALCATIAAFFVGVIWSYDGLKSLKPLLQNSLVLKPENNSSGETEA